MSEPGDSLQVQTKNMKSTIQRENPKASMMDDITKCDKDSDFMEMVKMKPAGSMQKKRPLKLLPNETVGKVP